MERGARRLKHRVDVPDIGWYDACRWYLTLYVINWLGQTSHIAPRPLTSRTESEVSNAGRNSTCVFTSLHRPQLPLNWSEQPQETVFTPLSSFSCTSRMFFFFLIALCLSSPPPQPWAPLRAAFLKAEAADNGLYEAAAAAVAALGHLFLNLEFSRISTDEYGVSKDWGKTWTPLVSFQSIMAKPVPWLLRLGILVLNSFDHFSDR